MRVLVACEFSQVVTSAFLAAGADAYSCDLCDCEGNFPRRHLKCDVHEVMYDPWDIVIAHPPCTYLAHSGACQWNDDTRDFRYLKMLEAKVFFLEFLALNTRVCVENPRPLKIANLPKPSFVVNPCDFGDPYTKRTYLWLKDLPPFFPTNIVEPEFALCSKFRDAKRRSIFSSGIAAAMAEAWL